MAIGFMLNIPKENLDGFPVATLEKLEILGDSLSTQANA